jgi:pilus assembly protein CpaC
MRTLQVHLRMKTLLLTWILTSLPAQAGELWLRVGEIQNLSASSDAVIRVGSRGIVRAVDRGETIQIVGLKPGVTSLVIDSRSYLVRVSLSAQKKFMQELRAKLHEMMGLSLSADGRHIEVQGTLLRFSDWQELADLAGRHQGDYVFAAGALPHVAEKALAYLNQLARDKGIPIARFSADPEFTVFVPKAAADLKEEVERVFKPFGIQVRISNSQLGIEPLVRTRVILAEVSKSFSQEFGVQWPSSYQAQILPQIKAQDGLMATLKALEAQGQAQILASPTLLCRSGGKAEFHAGGEFPIRIISRTARDVIWKQHGVILNVKPRADFHGAMSVELETEVSLLDMANAVDGVPALKKSSVKSHFDLAGRRTIALSGLLRQELGNSREGLPWLSQIPVLGALFSSRKFINHQAELVVFVTPEIYSPVNDEKIEMPAGWVKNEL